MSVSYIIQAVPSRLRFVDAIQLPRLAGADVQVAVDQNYTGSWSGMCQAIELAANAKHDYVCLIEDDAYPCERFTEIVPHLVEIEPYYPLLLCTCVKSGTQPVSLTKAPWKVGYYNTVAIVYEREHLQGMPAWVEQNVPRDPSDNWWRSTQARGFYKRFGQSVTDAQIINALKNWGDWLVSLYLIATDRPLVSTNPSLMQHLGYESAVKPGKKSPQKAVNYIGLRDPFSVDWTRKDYA